MNTISERLRREYADFGQRPRGFCNPDGPDAADTIDALVAALESMRDTYAIDGRGYPRTGPVVDQCRAALALARGGK